MPIKYENIFKAHKNFVGIMQMNFDKCFHKKKGKTVYIFKQVVQIQGFVKFEALHRRHLFSFVLLPVSAADNF